MQRDSNIAALERIDAKATRYFDDALAELTPVLEERFRRNDTSFYWEKLSPDLQAIAATLRADLLEATKVIARVCRSSVLFDQADLHDLSVAVKEMRAAVELREFSYSRGDVVHDEGTVLGYNPPSQVEAWRLSPDRASYVFRDRMKTVLRVYELADGAEHPDRAIIPRGPQTGDLRYRSGTAFVMMWMDRAQPDLEDVRDAIREVCRDFGINAVRADDIEHSGLITQRIIDEIATSEFLIADLTGARPSVYYEVGYAHALGKRVILLRKAGTDIHFDLAGYNCPEYRNIRELREIVTKRLQALTSKLGPT